MDSTVAQLCPSKAIKPRLRQNDAATIPHSRLSLAALTNDERTEPHTIHRERAVVRTRPSSGAHPFASCFVPPSFWYKQSHRARPAIGGIDERRKNGQAPTRYTGTCHGPSAAFARCLSTHDTPGTCRARARTSPGAHPFASSFVRCSRYTVPDLPSSFVSKSGRDHSRLAVNRNPDVC